MENKNYSVGKFQAPSVANLRLRGFKQDLYREERLAIKEDFSSVSKLGWKSDSAQEKLSAFATKVIEVVQDTQAVNSLIGVIMPQVEGGTGITFERHEIGGLRVTEGTYGAAARTFRPTLTPYIVTTNLKEVGVMLPFVNIETGKYSSTEIGEYAGNLIAAWRNKLIFDTFKANASFASSGTQYVDAGTLGQGDMQTAFDALTEDGDVKLMVGRRSALQRLSTLLGYTFSDTAKEEFEQDGNVMRYGGVPAMKIKSWTDPVYGAVYPVGAKEIWLFSELPAGAFAVARDVTAVDAVDMRSLNLEIIWRWEDGCALWKIKRAVRVVAT